MKGKHSRISKVIIPPLLECQIHFCTLTYSRNRTSPTHITSTLTISCTHKNRNGYIQNDDLGTSARTIQFPPHHQRTKTSATHLTSSSHPYLYPFLLPLHLHYHHLLLPLHPHHPHPPLYPKPKHPLLQHPPHQPHPRPDSELKLCKP